MKISVSSLLNILPIIELLFPAAIDKENLNRSDASMSGFDSPNVKLVSSA